jgi:hypothetical protein
MNKPSHPLSSPTWLRRAYLALVSGALLWTLLNCVYVYLVLHGERTYRIESSLWLLIALLLPLVLGGRTDADFVELTPGQRRGLLALATGLWLLTFLPLLDFPFLSDDFVFLQSYQHLTDVTVSTQFFRPLFALVFWTLARAGGGSPIPFHLASLLLHLSSACLVYALARRLFATTTPAVVCFSLFLLNPLQMEATLWVSGLQELLWTFFILAALRCYLGTRALSAPRLLATLALVACGLLSKETAICFVLLFPAADLALARTAPRPSSTLIVAYASFAAICVAYLLVRHQFASVDADFFVLPSRFFFKQFLVTPYKSFAEPWNAMAVHVPPLIPLLLTALMVSALFARVVLGTSPRLLWGPAVIAISTLPVYAYFYVGPDLDAARYVYCAAAGWALLVAQLSSTISKRAMFAGLVATLSVTSAVWLQFNLRPWRTAADVVNTMQAGLKNGERAEAIVSRWQTARGVTLELKHGVPYQHQGVDIFVNGYDLFLRMAQAQRH